MAYWDIGKLFYCKKDTFMMSTEYPEQGNDLYHIPAGKPFMVIYGQDGSDNVKVLYEDKIGWIDFNSIMFERYEDEKR
jgi:hypothetical protein